MVLEDNAHADRHAIAHLLRRDFQFSSWFPLQCDRNLIHTTVYNVAEEYSVESVVFDINQYPGRQIKLLRMIIEFVLHANMRAYY